MLIEAKDFYYEGRGNLASNEFDLQSEMRAAVSILYTTVSRICCNANYKPTW